MNTAATRLPSPLQVLAGSRSFREVDTSALEALINAASVIELQPSSALFRAGDDYCRCVFILVAGNLLMRRAGGEEIELQQGDFLGLANYLDNAPYASTAIALTQASVLKLSADRLAQLEQDFPPLFNALNRIIAHKLRERSPDRGRHSDSLARPVSSIMKTPVATCGPETTLLQAFQTMRERRIGSLVAVDESHRLLGVLTYAGLAEAVLLKQAIPGDSIMRAACQTPRTISPDTPLWKAEEYQQQVKAKYLIVVDGDTPIGMLSQTNLARSLASKPSILTSQILQTKSIKELAAVASRMVDVAKQARDAHRLPSAAVRYLSETHLAIQRRTVELTLQNLQEKGRGKPPVKFAVLIMGSGGRKEMLLNPDQDNGLIIEDSEQSNSSEVQEWFDYFSHRLNKNLDRVGYILCPGDIMARNPQYRKTLTLWKRQISHIAEKPTEKAARWANVMFDLDTLYGEDRLTADLRRHILTILKNQSRLLQKMAEHDTEGRPALGFFNQLITTTKDEGGEKIDLKRNGLRLIADAARIFAMQNGIAVLSTPERLTSLVRVGKLSDDFATSVREAYEELIDLLLAHQIKQARKGKILDKLIDPDKLTEQTRGTLRMAMRAVKRFQDRLQDDYGTEIF